MKPICVKCQRFYRPKKNGYWFIEGMPIGNGVPPGTSHDHQWEPYKLWRGDLWQCQGCGHEIVVGTGQTPAREHYEADFAEVVAKIETAERRKLLKVNDC